MGLAFGKSAPPPPGSESALERCKRESRGCDYCHGDGIVSVVHRDSIGLRPVVVEFVSSWGEVTQVTHPATTAAYCVCSYGEMIHAALPEHERRRWIKLQAVLEQRVPYQLTRPDLCDDPERLAVPGEPMTQVVRRMLAGMRPPRRQVKTSSDVARELQEARR